MKVAPADNDIFKNKYDELEDLLKTCPIGKMIIVEASQSEVKSLRSMVTNKSKKLNIETETRHKDGNLYIKVVSRQDLKTDLQKTAEILSKYTDPEVSSIRREIEILWQRLNT